ncbi:diguanylate cyclase [Pseudidiomarina insulisalsae]|uniref:diguanylate cyclase n=1 Tax=Pseudidiomarina insulisalsae TaxID=575789 RepID=A0A432YLN8_9GAMM|nr:diguanylate cyclase [Pseudidiomarina insulisalsae]RUO61808.1 PAS domain S-box protein [Pseudidiomarina insulisalsae]
MKLDHSFEKFANSLPFLFAFVDNDRCYRFVNSSFEAFFGVSLQDIKGKSIGEIVGPQSYAKVSKLHQRVLKGEELHFEDEIRLRDGRRLQLDVRYIPNRDEHTGEVHGFFTLINDITKYAGAAEVLRAVHDVVHRQSQTLSLDRIDKLLRLGCHYLNAQTGIASRIIKDDYIVEYIHTSGEPIAPGTCFNVNTTYCSTVLEAEAVVAIESITDNDDFQSHPCAKELEAESYIGFPIRVNGQTWGTLSFSNPTPRITPFSELEIELVSLVCSAIETVLLNSSKTKRLEQLAYSDFLTGLTNRLYLTERFEDIKARTNTTSNITCLALVDLDHFKKVNDTYGHDVGDLVLQRVARELSGIVRSTDCCSRVGGEEFALLLPDIPRNKSEQLLATVRTVIDRMRITFDDSELSLTVSIGATAVGEDESLSAAYKQADLALYQSKKNGRNQVTWADS